MNMLAISDSGSAGRAGHQQRPAPPLLELRGQLTPGPHIAAITAKDALEDSVELAHGWAGRLHGDCAKVELLRHHEAARLVQGDIFSG